MGKFTVECRGKEGSDFWLSSWVISKRQLQIEMEGWQVLRTGQQRSVTSLLRSGQSTLTREVNPAAPGFLAGFTHVALWVCLIKGLVEPERVVARAIT